MAAEQEIKRGEKKTGSRKKNIEANKDQPLPGGGKEKKRSGGKWGEGASLKVKKTITGGRQHTVE